MTKERGINQADAARARGYLLAALLMAVLGAIYENYSHGVYSNYMVYAFMIPLVLGCLPHLMVRQGLSETAGYLGETLLLTSVATLSAGSILKGVLEIYGTTNSLTRFYAPAGLLLLAGAAAVTIVNKLLKKAAG